MLVAAFVHLEHPVSSQDAKEDELTEEEAGGWAFAGVTIMSTPLKV